MLKHRLISFTILLSLFFTIVFCSNFYVSTIAAAILALPMSYFAVYEFLNMTENIGYGGFKKTGGWLAVIFTLCCIIESLGYFFIMGRLALFAVVFWLMILKNIGNVEKIKKTLMTAVAFFMIMAPLGIIISYLFFNGFIEVDNVVKVHGTNKLILLYVILVTKAGDTGAYCTGMICNKISGGKNHPVVLKVSPKKSVEGVVGGIFLSVIVSYLLMINSDINYIFVGEKNTMSVIIPLFYGIVLYFGGFFGDLVESSLKRTCGVKDSGNILPGMGGVLDVVDSLLVAVPIFCIAQLIISQIEKCFI